jgi:hypothetical protein
MEVAIVTIATGLSYGQAPAPTAQPAAIPARSTSVRSAGRTKRQQETAPPETASTPAAAKKQSAADLDELWSEAFEEAETVLPSMNAMRKATLAEMKENEFKVIVDSDFIKTKLENESQLICEIMEKHTGQPRRMVCRLQGQDEAEDMSDRLGQVVDKAESILGTSVKIK